MKLMLKVLVASVLVVLLSALPALACCESQCWLKSQEVYHDRYNYYYNGCLIARPGDYAGCAELANERAASDAADYYLICVEACRTQEDIENLKNVVVPPAPAPAPQPV